MISDRASMTKFPKMVNSDLIKSIDYTKRIYADYKP